MVTTVLGCDSGQPLKAGVRANNVTSTHMYSEESANRENGRESTYELMTDKLPPLDAIYLNYRNLVKFISCHANARVHQLKNKLHILVF